MPSYLIVIAGVAAGGVYFFVARPTQQFVEDNKEALLKTVANFEKCLVEQPAQMCREKLMTEDGRKAASTEGVALLGAKIKANLGNRLTVEPDEKSFTWNKYAGTGEYNLTISFNLKVAYEKDAHATETVSVMSYNGEPFLIRSWRINSNEMLR